MSISGKPEIEAAASKDEENGVTHTCAS